jgi:uncharacterized protein
MKGYAMSLNPHHVFRHGGELCLIDVEGMAAHVVDDEATAAALETLDAAPSVAIAPEVIGDYERLGLLPLRGPTPQKTRKPEPVPVSSITLFVTQECNMRCTYCYGDGGEYGSCGDMSQDTAFAAVDWLVAKSGRTKQVRICFFGGEPLLNLRLIEQVVPYARKRAEQAGKEVGFGITTNASLLDDEQIEFLRKHEIKPYVSFDGPKEIQDRQRPFKNGKGSYDAVVGRIRELMKVLPQAECRVTLVGDSDVAEIESALK